MTTHIVSYPCCGEKSERLHWLDALEHVRTHNRREGHEATVELVMTNREAS